MPPPAPIIDRPPARPVPTADHEIAGAGGVVLHAREWGDPAGAEVLFVHGWSQADLCWSAQLAAPEDALRMVTFDLRGHGRSGAPRDPRAYGDGRLWADDLAAVIEGVGLRRPVVVAWSYGGLVVGDYLRAHGERRTAGVVLVGAAVVLRPPAYEHIGPAFLAAAPEACSPDLVTAIAAVRRFLRACTARPLPADTAAEALAWNMVVPPHVRAAMIARDVACDDVLARLSVPVLVSHGREDAIVLPSMAEHVLAVCPSATASWYEGVGHMPFLEDPRRFNRELAAFAARAGAARGG